MNMMMTVTFRKATPDEVSRRIRSVPGEADGASSGRYIESGDPMRNEEGATASGKTTVRWSYKVRSCKDPDLDPLRLPALLHFAIEASYYTVRISVVRQCR